MSELSAIASALGARTTSIATGVVFTVRVGEQWLQLRGREHPHLELSVDAPDLRGLSVRLHLGRETLLGDEGPQAARAVDARWRIDGDDSPLLRELLDEAPWPTGVRGEPSPAGGGAATLLPLLGPVGVVAVAAGPSAWLTEVAGHAPTPRYVLTVEDGRARIERRVGELDAAHAIGAARRLLQLVTGPQRLPRPVPLPPPPGDGPYR